jgi:hypothetical protein
MSECPSDVREVNAAGDPSVLIDVGRIVVVNEIVTECLCKHHPRNYYKGHAESDECATRRQLTSSYLVHDCDCEKPNGKS